jgi:hypothetical protein
MGGHALRGALSAWVALIVLQTVGSAKNTGKLGSLFSDVNDLLKHAIRQDVPAIPDRAKGFTDSDGNYHPYIPGYLGGGTTTAPGAGKKANPKFKVIDPPPTGQHNPAYDPSNPNGGAVLE